MIQTSFFSIHDIMYCAEMGMRTYWKHNVAEDMQVVEYTAEARSDVSQCLCVRHFRGNIVCVFKRVILSLSEACFPAGRPSPSRFEGSFGIKSACRRQ